MASVTERLCHHLSPFVKMRASSHVFNDPSLPGRKAIPALRRLFRLNFLFHFLARLRSAPNRAARCAAGEPQGRGPGGWRTARLLVSHESQTRLRLTPNSFNTVNVGHAKQQLLRMASDLRVTACPRALPPTRAWFRLSQLILGMSRLVLFGLVLPQNLSGPWHNIAACVLARESARLSPPLLPLQHCA